MNEDQKMMLFGIALAVHLARIAGGNSNTVPAKSFEEAERFMKECSDRGIDLDKVRG